MFEKFKRPNVQKVNSKKHRKRFCSVAFSVRCCAVCFSIRVKLQLSQTFYRDYERDTEMEIKSITYTTCKQRHQRIRKSVKLTGLKITQPQKFSMYIFT